MGRPAATPPDLAAIFREALAHHQAGRLDDAERLYGEVLKARPDHFDSLHLLGVLHHQRGKFAQAIGLIDAALAINPNSAFAHSNRGVALHEQKRFSEALASCDRAIALKPDYPEALGNRGNALKELGRFEEALASYDRAIALKADDVEAFSNRGVALAALKRFDQALASCSKAIALAPHFAQAFLSRGNVLKATKQLDDALADYDRAIALKPDYAEAFVNRGVALAELQRFDEALASYDTAIALKPRDAAAFNNRGNALKLSRRLDEALESYDTAIALKPDYADAYYGRGTALQEGKRLTEAMASYQQAIALVPDHMSALSGVADCALGLCDFARHDELADALRRRVDAQSAIIAPLVLLGYSNDEALHLSCAKAFARSRIAVAPPPQRGGVAWRSDRIKLAYLSADFRQHAVAQLTAELFERHDRSRFEVIGVSLGPDDGSALRARLVRAFDRFHDVRAMSDRDVARFLHEQKIDITVDLTGYTAGCRPEILARRPSPMQVSYLGYPGTMGTDFIDYIIADRIVLPFDRQGFFTEKIVHLPDCYQANASLQATAAPTPTRREAGLPDAGFVFCGFNNHAKIAPPLFDIWMRLLGAADVSVLWLSAANDATVANLRRAAAARNIDPARLIFAPRTQQFEDHLARHRLAGLFLDTLPYNAHTTASDALRAGLPVLTCRGQSLAGRVAASLLEAIGLADLATSNLENYEALGLRLATDTALLAGFKARLDHNRTRWPLFDADRFRRHIEAAFTTMWEIWQRGEQPRSFAVAPSLPNPS